MFLTGTIFSRPPSRRPIFCYDYWSWSGKSRQQTQSTEREPRLRQMCELGELQPRMEERKLGGVSAWLIECLFLPPEIKSRLLKTSRNNVLKLTKGPNQ